MFVGHTCQPVGGVLLRGAVVCDASVVDDSYVAFFLSDLSSTHRCLVVSRGAAWSLIVSFLSAVACEVTGLSAEETCEDFPLSVLLDGSSWVPPFSAPSYSLFISVSSWKEVFCFCHSSARSSRGSIHSIWITWRSSPLITEWSPGGDGWQFLRFEMIGSVPHVYVYPLLINGCRSPLLVCCGLLKISKNVFVHCVWEGTCYGRLAVVSDVDDGGFALNVDKRVAEICRAISKQVQRSDAGIEVDVMHTGNELRYRALDKGLYDKRMYCRALDKGLQERREGVQGLDK
jgi:hypothetical protein